MNRGNSKGCNNKALKHNRITHNRPKTCRVVYTTNREASALYTVPCTQPFHLFNGCQVVILFCMLTGFYGFFITKGK